MSDEEYKAAAELLKLSGKDKALKKEAESFIESANAVLSFTECPEKEEGHSYLCADKEKKSVDREERLKNAKSVDGGYFCLPERGKIF